MKVDLSNFKIGYLTELPIKFIQSIIQGQMNTNGYFYDKKTKMLTMPDVTIDLFVTSDFNISEFSIWIQIPTGMTGDIPTGMTFSTTIDESGNTISRKWEEFTLYRQGINNKIVFLQGYTSNISIADTQVLLDNGFTLFSKPELQYWLSEPTSEYYIPDDV